MEEFKTSDYLFNKYEINKSGTIIRNIATKRPLTIKVDMHHTNKGYRCTFIHLGGRKNPKVHRIMIARAVLECWVGKTLMVWKLTTKTATALMITLKTYIMLQRASR